MELGTQKCRRKQTESEIESQALTGISGIGNTFFFLFMMSREKSQALTGISGIGNDETSVTFQDLNI